MTYYFFFLSLNEVKVQGRSRFLLQYEKLLISYGDCRRQANSKEGQHLQRLIGRQCAPLIAVRGCVGNFVIGEGCW